MANESDNPPATSSIPFMDDGGWVRQCSQAAGALGLTVDEDSDNDSERNHTTESAGIIAASTAFHANFNVDLLISKNVATRNEPLNGSSNPRATPGANVEYRIDVVNSGSSSPDTNTLTITDDVPDELRLCVTASCLAGGPVLLDASGSPVPPGVTLGPIDYSDDGGTSFSYSPIPDPDGYDAAVNAVRITLNGTLGSIATAGAPSFELQLAARVN